MVCSLGARGWTKTPQFLIGFTEGNCISGTCSKPISFWLQSLVFSLCNNNIRYIVVGGGNAPSKAWISVHFDLFPLTDRALRKPWLFLPVSVETCVYNLCNMDFGIEWNQLELGVALFELVLTNYWSNWPKTVWGDKNSPNKYLELFKREIRWTSPLTSL